MATGYAILRSDARWYMGSDSGAVFYGTGRPQIFTDQVRAQARADELDALPLRLADHKAHEVIPVLDDPPPARRRGGSVCSPPSAVAAEPGGSGGAGA